MLVNNNPSRCWCSIIRHLPRTIFGGSGAFLSIISISSVLDWRPGLICPIYPWVWSVAFSWASRVILGLLALSSLARSLLSFLTLENTSFSSVNSNIIHRWSVHPNDRPRWTAKSVICRTSRDGLCDPQIDRHKFWGAGGWGWLGLWTGYRAWGSHGWMDQFLLLNWPDYDNVWLKIVGRYVIQCTVGRARASIA